MKTRIFTYFAGFALCGAVICAEHAMLFGTFVNGFAPCTQNIENSFPCYGMYDIALMAIAAVLGIIFLCLLLRDVYRQGAVEPMQKLLAIFVAVLVVFCGCFAVTRHYPNPLVGSGLIPAIAANTPESAEFAQQMQRHVIETIGQPIDSGFTAALYLQVFPGLTEADFDSVQTWEGRYVYAGGKLAFTRPDTGRWSTAEEAITENGHQILLDALKRRLGSDLTVDEIINHLESDAGTPLVSVGDTLGAMEVSSVAPFNSGQYSTDPKMMRIGPRNIQITLKGPIEITGTYSAVHSGIGFDGYCMSVSDAASLSRMPKFPVRGGTDDTRSYFCFRNEGAAQQKLGEESRNVTVTIDNYELNSYPAEVVDRADLVDVITE